MSGRHTNRGGGTPQRDTPTAPPKSKEEAEAQGGPFYVRGFVSNSRIENAIKRDKLCPICGGVEKPASAG